MSDSDDSEEQCDEFADEEPGEPSAYELERDANVARNHQVLASLGLAGGASQLTGKKNSGKGKAIEKKKKTLKRIHVGPTRASIRLLENAPSSAKPTLDPDPCLPPQPYDFYPNKLVRDICGIAINGIREKRPDGPSGSHMGYAHAQAEYEEEEEEAEQVAMDGNENKECEDM